MKTVNKLMVFGLISLFPVVAFSQNVTAGVSAVSTTTSVIGTEAPTTDTEVNTDGSYVVSTTAFTDALQKVSDSINALEFSPEGWVRHLNVDSIASVNRFNTSVLKNVQIPYVNTIVDAVNSDIQDNKITEADVIALQYAKASAVAILNARKEGRLKLVLVNISSYSLDAIDAVTGELAFRSKVIVGKHRATPIFSTNITSLTVNPTWTPTLTILRGSVFPSVGKPKGYAARTGMVAVGSDGSLIDLGSPDVTASEVRGLRIYQPAGDDNALGVIRFNTDNKQAIYLHDTNERYLFKKDKRAYSHGCIRVQEWQKLGLWLSGWDADKLQEKLDTKETNTYRVDKVLVTVINYPVDITNEGVASLDDPYAVTKPKQG
ncbi:MAG: hypothetical protein EPN31_15610 [Castellaniella sp.]|uniref:L,D-transpeptidase family protein n=1 Tax=Castellaniella sp. TaxID=1955812 RepID=UPI00121ACD9C|nr:L,D-transpeptidase family protein [Castellaniella sp.]TAN25285.1 MAG: hypothetical protein EPN31_15610 [Castellaniella sp.]